MRVRINNGGLEVDLISTTQEATRVVELSLSAGLTNFHSSTGEEGMLRIMITPPNGVWGTSGFAAMLALASALSGNDVDPHAVLDRYLSEHPRFVEARASVLTTAS